MSLSRPCWVVRAIVIPILVTLVSYPVALFLKLPSLSLLAYLPEILVGALLLLALIISWLCQARLELYWTCCALIAFIILRLWVIPKQHLIPRSCEGQGGVKIWSWNCQSWLSDPAELIPWVLSKDWDIICLQEAQHPGLIKALEGSEENVFWRQGHVDEFNECDLLILSRFPFGGSQAIPFGASWGLEAEIKLSDHKVFKILNMRQEKWPLKHRVNAAELYTLWSRQYDELSLVAAQVEKDKIDCVLGDWNSTPWSLGAQRLFAQGNGLYGGYDFPHSCPLMALSWGVFRGEGRVFAETISGLGSDHRILKTVVPLEHVQNKKYNP